MGSAEFHNFYRRYIAALNAREFDFVETLIADDVLMNDVPSKRADVMASLRHHVDAVPDFVWHIEDLLVEGDRIGAKLRDTGTPRKEWWGLAPTGASVEYAEHCFYTVRDGRFVDMAYLMDVRTVAEQLAA